MRDFVRKEVPGFIGAGLLVALGAVFAVGSSGYGLFGSGGRIGPGFVPFATGVLLIAFGGFIGVQAWRSRAEGASHEFVEDEAREQGAETGEEGSNRPVALVFGLTLVTILLAPVIGFLVSFGLLVLALVAFVERQSFLLGLALSVVATALTWLVFVRFLQVPLPQGIFVSGSGG